MIWHESHVYTQLQGRIQHLFKTKFGQISHNFQINQFIKVSKAIDYCLNENDSHLQPNIKREDTYKQEIIDTKRMIKEEASW